MKLFISVLWRIKNDSRIIISSFYFSASANYFSTFESELSVKIWAQLCREHPSALRAVERLLNFIIAIVNRRH